MRFFTKKTKTPEITSEYQKDNAKEQSFSEEDPLSAIYFTSSYTDSNHVFLN